MPSPPKDAAFALIDLLCAIVLLLAIGVAAIAADEQVSEKDKRIACAKNLRLIGQSMLLYSVEQRRGELPRGVFDPATTSTPTFGTPYADMKKPGPVDYADPFAGELRVKANDISVVLFLLMRTQDLSSDKLVCPSTKQTPWAFGDKERDATNWSNFPGKQALRDHLSYSVANPYPSNAALDRGFKWNDTISSATPVVSDLNPGGEALLKLTPESDQKAVQAVNSPNHQGVGQNVLFGDGHVEFCVTPLAGEEKDNLFTRGRADATQDWEKPSVVGAATSNTDMVLLPTAEQLKPDEKPAE